MALVDEINQQTDLIQTELKQQDPSAQPLQRLDKMAQAWVKLQSDINGGALTFADRLC